MKTVLVLLALAQSAQPTFRAGVELVRLDVRVRHGDRVALYALPGPGPQIGFTADARRVAAELIKVRGQAEQQTVGWTGTMTPQEAVQIVRGDEQLLQRVADRIQGLVGPTDLQRRADPSLINTSA